MLRRFILIFGYVCFVGAIVAFTALLVAYGNDYSYDFATHAIIQKGHVIINSIPDGVNLSEDGKSTNKHTPYQAVVKVGAHSYQLTRDGFWPWQKVIQIIAGRVALVDYAILLPKKPAVTDLDSRQQILAQAISKDHRHLAYITGGADPGLYILDIGAKKTVKLYSPKPATASLPIEVLQEVTWSDDASHLLLSSTLGTTPDHRLLSASGDNVSIDLTAVFGFNLTGIKFSGSNWRQLFWVSADGLRRIDSEATTVSGVLADNVTQFWVQPDRVLYVQKTDLGRSLWSLDNRGKRQELIQALVQSDSYQVALSKYNGNDELAVVPTKTGVATLYTGIFGDTPIAKVLAKDITSVSFSPDAHLLSLSTTSTTSVYDLERSSTEQTLVRYLLPAYPGNISSQTWFDNYHLLITHGSQLYWSEYDGNNTQAIGDVYGSFPSYVDADAHQVITMQPVETGVKILELQIR
jgi:hypothetical protein